MLEGINQWHYWWSRFLKKQNDIVFYNWCEISLNNKSSDCINLKRGWLKQISMAIVVIDLGRDALLTVEYKPNWRDCFDFARKLRNQQTKTGSDASISVI